MSQSMHASVAKCKQGPLQISAICHFTSWQNGKMANFDQITNLFTICHELANGLPFYHLPWIFQLANHLPLPCVQIKYHQVWFTISPFGQLPHLNCDSYCRLTEICKTSTEMMDFDVQIVEYRVIGVEEDESGIDIANGSNPEVENVEKCKNWGILKKSIAKCLKYLSSLSVKNFMSIGCVRRKL